MYHTETCGQGYNNNNNNNNNVEIFQSVEMSRNVRGIHCSQDHNHGLSGKI